MEQNIYMKTAAGLAEIQARQMRLHPRTRSLLVLIDGKHSVAELLDTLAGIGIRDSSFDELAQLGLISLAAGSTQTASTMSEAAGETAAAAPRLSASPDPSEPEATHETSSAHQQMRALYAFFNDHIRDALGLRGFMMQLQVEKAESIADYHAIRDQFLSAVRKSKGEMAAAALQVKVDRLLGASA
ncbi:hypothetical protein OPU71_00680 [Niveibacterium sp. 24ML]|uniref:hypothetical protein n=1 Tax=Niveibacterium sp. 24ML TaxID=2985512 RepID=UPI00227093F3|nr:hypothetical protein [Niveibacterium sp. 24ML]MCX9154632.1 hypothetical protein [Niveibacterium sp. 24ML]